MLVIYYNSSKNINFHFLNFKLFWIFYFNNRHNLQQSALRNLSEKLGLILIFSSLGAHLQTDSNGTTVFINNNHMFPDSPNDCPTALPSSADKIAITLRQAIQENNLMISTLVITMMIRLCCHRRHCDGLRKYTWFHRYCSRLFICCHVAAAATFVISVPLFCSSTSVIASNTGDSSRLQIFLTRLNW